MREGRVPAAEAAPCLVDFGLLHPDLDNPLWLEPVAPAVALHRLLRTSEERVADERRRTARPAAVFEPLMWIDGRLTESANTSSITLLRG